ncbi:unnamed protein product [Rotaria sp. Silwood2]|nr:unnamed protein product [Rotaria sp. Silwood2]CAF2904591.1 unnamed protein product [Rotaria sp. Silwood2]CAF4229185.1 unnamed protein product [Rotaria sp. Silwood2]CAF4394762.1 unnamed protein product [Rotaria sp. Silwood2]
MSYFLFSVRLNDKYFGTEFTHAPDGNDYQIPLFDRVLCDDIEEPVLFRSIQNDLAQLDNIYQQISYAHSPVYSRSCSSNIIPANHFKPFTKVQPWSFMPSIDNNPPFNESSYFKKIKKKQTSLNRSSYRVTVRRITAPHIAAAAVETYRMHKNKVSNTIHYEQLNQTVINNHERCRTLEATNIYKENYYNSNNENIPSVPFKKILIINNGIQMSSTSLIITNNDQINLISDNNSEENFSEHYMKQVQTFNELLPSMTQISQSTNDSIFFYWI